MTMKNCNDVKDEFFLNNDILVLSNNLRRLNNLYGELEIRLPTEAEIRLLEKKIFESAKASSDIANLINKLWENAPVVDEALLHYPYPIGNPGFTNRPVSPDKLPWELCNELPVAFGNQDGIQMINVAGEMSISQKMMREANFRNMSEVDYRLVIVSG